LLEIDLQKRLGFPEATRHPVAIGTLLPNESERTTRGGRRVLRLELIVQRRLRHRSIGFVFVER
jgi:hypothetical protein